MTAARHADTARAGAVHIHAGWYALRCSDGSVTLWSSVAQEEITIPAKRWASLVAAMTAGGDSSASHEAALALHQGG